MFDQRQRHSLAVILALAVILVSAAANAREDLSRYPVSTFSIIERGGEIGAEAYYFEENQSSDDGTDVELRNTTFHEYIKYRVRGYGYHPRFLDFTTQVKLGLTQQRIRRSTDIGGADKSFDSNTFVNGYDIYLKFLQEHPVSLDVFANRDEHPVIGLFTDRVMIRSENRGAILRWKNKYVPMDFSYTQSRIEEDGFESSSIAEIDTFEYTARNKIGEWMSSRLRYRVQDYRQHFRSHSDFFDFDRENELDQQDLDFVNTIYLRPDKRSSLNTIARYHDQTGTTDLTTYSLQERLRLQHRDNLSSYYMGSFLRNELTAQTIDTYRAEAGLDHLLYQSLQSHFDVHWRQTEYGKAEDSQYGVTARTNYRKQTGAGVLSAGYGITVDQITREGRSGSRLVLDEQLALTEGTTVFLNSSNVSEIVAVTDAAGLVQYIEGFDYEVVRIGGRTGLRVLPGGTLFGGAPVDIVLVDYRVSVDDDLDYRQLNQDFFVRHDFDRYINGLAVYYHWHDLRNSGIDDDNRVLEYNDQMAGFQYRWRWLTWTEEYQQYRSNFGDYDQWRSRLDGAHRLNDRLRWAWNVGYDRTDYMENIAGTNEDIDQFLFAGTGLHGSFLRRNNGFWNVEARGSREMGRTDRNIVGVLARVGVQWRKVRLEGGARYEYFDVFDSERDRMHVFVQIARTF